MKHEKLLRVFALICLTSVLTCGALPKFHKPTARTAPKKTPHPPSPPAPTPQPHQQQPVQHTNNAPPPSYQSAVHQQPQQPVYHPQQFNQPQSAPIQPQPQSPVVVHHVIQQQPARSSSGGGLGTAGGLAVGALAGLQSVNYS
jgi:hypothetical protein